MCCLVCRKFIEDVYKKSENSVSQNSDLLDHKIPQNNVSKQSKTPTFSVYNDIKQTIAT